MTPRLRDVVASALEAWGCAWEEVERNLLHVEIEPGTIAETVLEATGSVHLGLVEFEEDVAAMFPCWRSCAPGSYFLHRLLEVLRGGPETGTTAVIATHQPPAAVEVMPEGGEILGSCCRYTGTPSAIDQELATTVYHFEVRLIGVDPTSEIVDVTVEPLRFNVLRSVSLGAQQVVDREPARAAEDIMDGFVLAADTVRQETNRLLERYAAEHANEAASAIRRIREAARSELTAMCDRLLANTVIESYRVELA